MVADFGGARGHDRLRFHRARPMQALPPPEARQVIHACPGGRWLEAHKCHRTNPVTLSWRRKSRGNDRFSGRKCARLHGAMPPPVQSHIRQRGMRSPTSYPTMYPFGLMMIYASGVTFCVQGRQPFLFGHTVGLEELFDQSQDPTVRDALVDQGEELAPTGDRAPSGTTWPAQADNPRRPSLLAVIGLRARVRGW